LRITVETLSDKLGEFAAATIDRSLLSVRRRRSSAARRAVLIFRWPYCVQSKPRRRRGFLFASVLFASRCDSPRGGDDGSTAPGRGRGGATIATCGECQVPFVGSIRATGFQSPAGLSAGSSPPTQDRSLPLKPKFSTFRPACVNGAP
jgi:hypothetical protein